MPRFTERSIQDTRVTERRRATSERMCACFRERGHQTDRIRSEMAEATGMPTPNDIPTFLLSGDLGKDSRGRDRTVSNDHSGILFIGWRCIYAAIVNSRIEDTLLKDETALKRAVSMIISRIRAAAGSLRSNIEASRNQRRPKMIGRKKRRDRKVMSDSQRMEVTRSNQLYSNWRTVWVWTTRTVRSKGRRKSSPSRRPQGVSGCERCSSG